EGSADLVELLGCRVVAAHVHGPAYEVDEWMERAVAELRPALARHPHAVERSGVVLDRFGQAGFAEARFAREHGEAPFALFGGAAKEFLQHPLLGLSAHDGGEPRRKRLLEAASEIELGGDA